MRLRGNIGRRGRVFPPGGSGPAPFDPASLNPSWWLKGDDNWTIVQNFVSEWGDKSAGGLGDWIPPGASQRPSILSEPRGVGYAIDVLNPHNPAMYGDVARTFGQVFPADPSNYHYLIFAVNPARVDSLASTLGYNCDTIFGQASSGYYGIGLQIDGAGTGARVVATFNDGAYKTIRSADDSIILGQWNIIEWEHAAGEQRLWVNGVAATPVATGALNALALSQNQRLGANYVPAGGTYLRGAIGEVVGLDAAPSAGNLAALRNYMLGWQSSGGAYPAAWDIQYGLRGREPTTLAFDSLIRWFNFGSLATAQAVSQAVQVSQPTWVTWGGHYAVSFDGVNDWFSAGPTLANSFGAGPKHLLAAVDIGAVTALSSALPELSDCIVGDTSGYWGVFVRQDGLGGYELLHYQWDGTRKVATTPITLGKHLIEARYDGTNLYVRVDDNAESSPAASGSATLTTGPVLMGRRSTAPFFTGAIGEVIGANSHLTGADVADARALMKARWGL